jgi:hypothetical protein
MRRDRRYTGVVMMKNTEAAKNVEAFRELMAMYNEQRAAWVKEKGSARGFDKWFSEQLEAPGEDAS